MVTKLLPVMYDINPSGSFFWLKYGLISYFKCIIFGNLLWCSISNKTISMYIFSTCENVELFVLKYYCYMAVCAFLNSKLL